MNLRAAAWAALEVLADGDELEAERILLSALEDGSTERSCRCPECGLGFQWPGEVDHHRRFGHRLAEDKAA